MIFLTLLFSTLQTVHRACIQAPKQPLTAVVTAYTPYETCTAQNDCIMANGEPAREGHIACPRKYPFGTQVEILGEVYTCSDHTAEKYDGRFDIYMDDYERGYTLRKTNT